MSSASYQHGQDQGELVFLYALQALPSSEVALVGAHIAAILYYKYWKFEGLTLPMITGRKMLPRGLEGKRMVNPIWALLILAAIGALVYATQDALKPPPSPFAF